VHLYCVETPEFFMGDNDTCASHATTNRNTSFNISRSTSEDDTVDNVVLIETDIDKQTDK
jgi:hypothetical protein